MDFWRAVDILNKRKWLIVMSVVVTLALTFGVTKLIGSKWVATVNFASNGARSTADVAPGATVDPSMDPRTARTQAALYTAIVKSQPVMGPVLDKAQVPPSQRESLMANITFDSSGAGIFQLKVSDSSPQRATILANEVSTKFLDRFREIYTAEASNVLQNAQTQFDKVNERLEKARKRYSDFRARKGLTGTVTDQVGPAMTKLSYHQTERDSTRERLNELEARLADRRSSLANTERYLQNFEQPVQNPVLVGLRQRLAQAKGDQVVLEAQYTKDHPEVKKNIALQAELQTSIDQLMNQGPMPTGKGLNPEWLQLDQEVKALHHEVGAAKAHLASLDRTVQSAEAEVRRYVGVDAPLLTLVNDVTQLMQLRSQLSDRVQLAQNGYDQAVRQNPLQLMDGVSEFNPPVNTSSGRTTKIILLAALCALLGTAGLLIAYDSLDRRLRSVRDAEAALPGPVLTAIPQPVGNMTEKALPRATETHPLSLHSEAYRFLGLHLLSARGKRIRSIMVMSAKADQGSLQTVTNLGITLAQAGKRVIVVDANIRTPRLHEAFGLNNQFGLTDLLQHPDAASLESALHATTVPNLRVITSGPGYSNPWELFRSQNLMEMAQRLSDLADYVIYDTPSALAFTDALNLAPAVDAAFLCVRALEAPSGAEQRLTEMLEDANVVVLGSVLSNVPATILESYHNYQRYYPNQPNEAVPALGSGGTAVAARTQTWVETGTPNGSVGYGPNGVNGHNGANGHSGESPNDGGNPPAS